MIEILLAAAIAAATPPALDLAVEAGLLSREESHCADLAEVWFRAVDLVDCPDLHDLYRWPGSGDTREAMNFNRAYRSHLEARHAWEKWNQAEIWEALIETDRLWKVWDTLDDAHLRHFSRYRRRQALRTLRELLGEDAYARGAMPPPVPLQYLRAID